jgi:hypothetical protein
LFDLGSLELLCSLFSWLSTLAPRPFGPKIYGTLTQNCPTVVRPPLCRAGSSHPSQPYHQRLPKAVPNAPGWTAAPASTSEPWLHVTANSILAGRESFLQRSHMLHLTKTRSTCLSPHWRVEPEGEKLQSGVGWTVVWLTKALEKYCLPWEIHGMHFASTSFRTSRWTLKHTIVAACVGPALTAQPTQAYTGCRLSKKILHVSSSILRSLYPQCKPYSLFCSDLITPPFLSHFHLFFSLTGQPIRLAFKKAE